MNNYILKISPHGFKLTEREDSWPIYEYSSIERSIKEFQKYLSPILKKYEDCDITVVNDGFIEEQLKMMFFEMQYFLYANGMLRKIPEGSLNYIDWLHAQLTELGFECDIVHEINEDYVKVIRKRSF